MQDHSQTPGGAPLPPPPAALVDRVRSRLALAGARFDRRHAASRPNSRRGKAAPPPTATSPQPDPAQRRDRACLRAVFHELGIAHRRYRARTGHIVTPDLRAATTAFKQAPSLGSLVPVAAFLDELGLLDW